MSPQGSRKQDRSTRPFLQNLELKEVAIRQIAQMIRKGEGPHPSEDEIRRLAEETFEKLKKDGKRVIGEKVHHYLT